MLKIISYPLPADARYLHLHEDLRMRADRLLCRALIYAANGNFSYALGAIRKARMKYLLSAQLSRCWLSAIL